MSEREAKLVNMIIISINYDLSILLSLMKIE